MQDIELKVEPVAIFRVAECGFHVVATGHAGEGQSAFGFLDDFEDFFGFEGLAGGDNAELVELIDFDGEHVEIEFLRRNGEGGNASFEGLLGIARLFPGDIERLSDAERLSYAIKSGCRHSVVGVNKPFRKPDGGFAFIKIVENGDNGGALVSGPFNAPARFSISFAALRSLRAGLFALPPWEEKS